MTDFQQVLNFLYAYRGNDDTFNAYQRELERFIQSSWFVQGKSLFSLKVWTSVGIKVVLGLRELIQTTGRWQQFWQKIDQYGVPCGI